MAWYWAYGPSQDEESLKQSCPSAKRLGTAKLPTARPAFYTLEGTRFFALGHDEKLDMWGTLFFIDDVELMNVAYGKDRPFQVGFRPVWDGDNKAYNAYLLEPADGAEETDADPEIVETLLAIAATNEYPKKYVTALEGLKPAKKEETTKPDAK